MVWGSALRTSKLWFVVRVNSAWKRIAANDWRGKDWTFDESQKVAAMLMQLCFASRVCVCVCEQSIVKHAGIFC